MKKISTRKIFYIGFFTALIIVFYFVLSALIPDFTKRRLPPISYVRPFSFIDQDGKRITNKDVAGKVYVVEYFYTTCTTICPRMNANMFKVYDEFKNEKDFLILSHTCQPENDSVSQLKDYANLMHVSSPPWLFLTGRKDSLYNMARVSYMVDDPNNNPSRIEDDFIHTQHWALVDKTGNVVGIYDGLKQAEINKLKTDIKKLLKD